METKTKKQGEKSSKFLSGALIGAVLGVAAGIFATSKKGKEMGREVKDKSVEFYNFIAPQLKKVREMGEQEYKKFINKAVLEYKKNKNLSTEQVKNIAKEAHASWKHLKKHL